MVRFDKTILSFLGGACSWLLALSPNAMIAAENKGPHAAEAQGAAPSSRLTCGSEAGIKGTMEAVKPYKRILLKMSGEMLRATGSESPIDGAILEQMCGEIKRVWEAGIQVAVVIGGGNIFRGIKGSAEKGIERSSADYMGMLATMINAIAIREFLGKIKVPACLQSALAVDAIGEPINVRRAIQQLESGTVVVFAAGTGSPYFSTDTAAALRASEIHAEAILKATKVDGVYNKDPQKHKDAVKYATLSFREALDKKLGVMDATAFSLCMETNIPIIVFEFTGKDSALQAAQGQPIGTVVSNL